MTASPNPLQKSPSRRFKIKPDPHILGPSTHDQQPAGFPLLQLSQIFGTYSRLSICANLMFGYFYKN
jgi:hypothetical protein